MATFVVRRFAAALLLLFAVSVVVFLVLVAPGAHPATRIAGPGATPRTLTRVGQLFGIGRPLPVQYALLMEHLFVTRDLTSSLGTGREVVPEILHAAPVTLSLLAGAVVAWMLVGVAGGLLATRIRGRVVDPLVVLSGVAGAAVPAYWLGAVVRTAVATHRHSPVSSLFPVSGYSSPSHGVGSWALHLVLPWLSLAILYGAVYARVLRRGLVGSLDEPYATTARAKGLGEWRVLLRHALRCSVAPLVARLGLDVASLAGGAALLVEVVFGLPGVGSLLYESVRRGDTATMIGCVMYVAAFAVVVHALADVAARALDPGARRV
ncbi:MAG: ABC transporter permease [Actinomycetota bacterium]|nr:ABC transporter permease [Actinomycetota bacterium]